MAYPQRLPAGNGENVDRCPLTALELAFVYPCHCFLVLIFQLQEICFALVNDRNLDEVLYHTDLSAYKSLF